MYQSIWNWIQHYYKPTKKVWQKKRTKISQFIIIDETVIRVGRERRRSSSSLVIDGWIAIEPKSKSILDMYACVFL